MTARARVPLDCIVSVVCGKYACLRKGVEDALSISLTFLALAAYCHVAYTARHLFLHASSTVFFLLLSHVFNGATAMACSTVRVLLLPLLPLLPNVCVVLLAIAGLVPLVGLLAVEEVNVACSSRYVDDGAIFFVTGSPSAVFEAQLLLQFPLFTTFSQLGLLRFLVDGDRISAAEFATMAELTRSPSYVFEAGDVHSAINIQTGQVGGGRSKKKEATVRSLFPAPAPASALFSSSPSPSPTLPEAQCLCRYCTHGFGDSCNPTLVGPPQVINRIVATDVFEHGVKSKPSNPTGIYDCEPTRPSTHSTCEWTDGSFGIVEGFDSIKFAADTFPPLNTFVKDVPDDQKSFFTFIHYIFHRLLTIDSSLAFGFVGKKKGKKRGAGSTGRSLHKNLASVFLNIWREGGDTETKLAVDRVLGLYGTFEGEMFTQFVVGGKQFGHSLPYMLWLLQDFLEIWARNQRKRKEDQVMQENGCGGSDFVFFLEANLLY